MEMIIISSVVFACILALAAVSGSLIERSGTINLSIEAFMIFGGLNYALMATKFKDGPMANQIWLLLLSGFIPMMFGILYGFVTITLRANQTIAGIALNALAIAIAGFVIASKINPSLSVSSQYINLYDTLWSFGKHNRDYLQIFNIGVLLSIVLIAGIFILLNTTKLGIKIKTCGENPQAGASLGINVVRVRYGSILISSFITGIAGAIFFQFSGTAYNGNTQGIGFLAVAMVIFGQWRPTYITISSAVFGVLYTIANKILLIDFLAARVPKELFYALPFFITLVILAFTQKNSKAPKSLGIPFKNQGR